MPWDTNEGINALEEPLVNAYYHRRYDEYQPVEVNIMPDQIEIISYGGAERSIKLDDLRAGKRIHARRYRNPRLGEFLKELHLTEGRGTGLPTIHEEIKKNGSPNAIIDVDDEHTYFIIRIPCHPEFVCEELSMDKEGHILPLGEVWNPDVIDDVIDNVTDKVVDNIDVISNAADNVTENVTGNVTKNVTDEKAADKRRKEVIRLMRLTPTVTMNILANILHVTPKTISRDIKHLRANGKLKREGDDRSGRWVVIE